MKNFKITIITLALILLTGCMPMYRPPDFSRLVNLDVSALQSPEICINHKWYSLMKNKQGIAKIPYGNRVTLDNHFYQPQAFGNGNISCFPSLSFEPQKGETYYADFRLKNEICLISMYVKSDINKLGIALEPSTAAGEC